MRLLTNSRNGRLDRSTVPNTVGNVSDSDLPIRGQSLDTGTNIPIIPSNIKTRVSPSRFTQTAGESEGANFIVSLPLEIRELDFKTVIVVDDKSSVSSEVEDAAGDSTVIIRERSEYTDDELPEDDSAGEPTEHGEMSGKLSIPVKTSRPMVGIRATDVELSYFDDENESDTPNLTFMSGNTSTTGVYGGNFVSNTLLTDFTWRAWGQELFTYDVWSATMFQAFAGQSEDYELNRDKNLFISSSEPPLKSTTTSFTIRSLGMAEEFERDTRGINVVSLTDPTMGAFESWVEEADVINKA